MLDMRSLPDSIDDTAHEPESVWEEVTRGALAIVDWYDENGRRYLVTRPNRARGSALTERQKRVLALRSAGSSLKVVAFELGVSLSTAARDLERAMASLGLESQGDLVAVLGHAGG
jgi:DNA-binding NarL/FixJ family response regulator